MRTVGQAGTQAIRRCRQIFDSGRTEYDIEMSPAGEVENRRYWPRWSSSSDKSHLEGPLTPARSLARRVLGRLALHFRIRTASRSGLGFRFMPTPFEEFSMPLISNSRQQPFDLAVNLGGPIIAGRLIAS